MAVIVQTLAVAMTSLLTPACLSSVVISQRTEAETKTGS
jgi:hypothetical protein